MSSSKILEFVAQCASLEAIVKRKPQNNESIGKSVEWITIPIPEGETFHGKMSSVRIKSVCCDSRKQIILNSVKKHASPLNIQMAVEWCASECIKILKHP